MVNRRTSRKNKGTITFLETEFILQPPLYMPIHEYASICREIDFSENTLKFCYNKPSETKKLIYKLWQDFRLLMWIKDWECDFTIESYTKRLMNIKGYIAKGKKRFLFDSTKWGNYIYPVIIDNWRNVK